MKIEKLVLKNFRSFEDETIEFSKSNFTVLVGPNGCGKSSVLDALGYVLVKLFNEFKNDNIPFSLFDLSPSITDIKVGAESLSIKGGLLYFGDQRIEVPVDIDISGMINLRSIISDGFGFNGFRVNQEVLPVLVYYKTDRTNKAYTTIEVDKKYENIDQEKKKQREQFSAYTNAFDDYVNSFSDFESWFLNKENYENQEKVQNDPKFALAELSVVKNAIKQFLTLMNKTEFDKLRGKREFRRDGLYTASENLGRLVITKGEDTLYLHQLSSGEKMLIFLVADIARRLTILNENSKDSLQGNGIVLIDEIEMHLHPSWQRNIIPALKKVFPNVQFIVTTHSPQIISSVTSEEIIILEDGKSYKTDINPIGRDSNGILEEIFDVKERPEHVDKLIDEIYLSISKGEVESELLDKKVVELKKLVSNADPVLIGIENLISRTKILQS